MDASALAGLHTQVLLGALGLALLLGAALQRSHFCIMGAVSDAALIGDWTRGRMWAVAGGVAVLGFGLLAHGGWVTAAQTLYGGARLLWASALGGGLLVQREDWLCCRLLARAKAVMNPRTPKEGPKR